MYFILIFCVQASTLTSLHQAEHSRAWGGSITNLQIGPYRWRWRLWKVIWAAAAIARACISVTAEFADEGCSRSRTVDRASSINSLVPLIYSVASSKVWVSALAHRLFSIKNSCSVYCVRFLLPPSMSIKAWMYIMTFYYYAIYGI